MPYLFNHGAYKTIIYMEQKKNINIKIKKNTLNFIGKNVLLVLCCFILAISYPFLNIYFSEITTNTNSIIKDTYVDYDYSTYMKPLFGQDKKLISKYLFEYNRYNIQYMGDRFFYTPKLSTTIDLIFGIREYKSIFNYIFYPLLIMGIVIMNFKFNFKIKDE